MAAFPPEDRDDHDRKSDRELLLHIARKVDHMAVGIAEVLADLTTLTTDLEGLATTAQAEFTKLEEEVAAGNTAPDLQPVKDAIDAIDAKVKAAVVPTA